MERISKAAQALFSACCSWTPLGQLPTVARLNTEAEAYRVQEAVHELAATAWGAVVGYKIGCATPVVQSDVFTAR